MSIKLHYLHCHLANLQENLGGVSNKPGEQFLRYLKVVEDRYEGRWDMHMMVDYVWSIKRNSPQFKHSRKSYKHIFLP